MVFYSIFWYELNVFSVGEFIIFSFFIFEDKIHTWIKKALFSQTFEKLFPLVINDKFWQIVLTVDCSVKRNTKYTRRYVDSSV